VFVKVCGNTNEEDALLAVALGADAVGFIFAPSPRQITPLLAGDIARRLPPEILTVGVFRDEVPARVAQVVNELGLKAAQLHGSESVEDFRWVSERVPLTIKAFQAGHPAMARALAYGADMVLLDAPSPGSGQVFDWRLAETATGIPRLILAGGLSPGNVAEAISSVHPWGVDVVTGVEASPGHKDPHLLRTFIAAAKAAAPPGYEGEGVGPYNWQDEL